MAESAAAAAPTENNGSSQDVAAIPQMTEEQKAEAWQQFEAIIYSNLDRVLEKRPAFPVTKFAKAILEEVNLDENGDPILKKKKKKDKKKKDKKDKKGKGDGEEAKDDDEAGKKDKKKKDKKKASAAAEEAD